MLSREDRTDLNQWPADQLEFRQAMEKFFIQASDIAERTLQLVYRALKSSKLVRKPAVHRVIRAPVMCG